MRDGWVKVSDSQNFWRGKDVYYQFCSEIYGLQEQVGDTDFSENEWTFGYCIQISQDLDTNYIQIFKDFDLVFHWVSKHMHVMWYTSSDL